ncbi:hypothetical protein [Streptomyces sp. NPDC097610]|uniref:hypothetical protein n=1 Tax=Streptomyces sp. NPDC097610 TaxID=3157227 RepID=UPI0033330D72
MNTASEVLAKLLLEHRERLGTRKGTRALGPFKQSGEGVGGDDGDVLVRGVDEVAVAAADVVLGILEGKHAGGEVAAEVALQQPSHAVDCSEVQHPWATWPMQMLRFGHDITPAATTATTTRTTSSTVHSSR